MTGKNPGGKEPERVWADRVAHFATRIVRWLGYHWLLLVAAGTGLFAGLPFAAAYLMASGRTIAARAIYIVFAPLCHQRPERSFFLYGAKPVYTIDELVAHLGAAPPSRWVGDAGLGYKMAVCERDVAIYGGLFLMTIVCGIWRRRIKPLGTRTFLALAAPMAIDGGGQLIGLWSSTWLSRVVTGSLFAIGMALFTYPRLQDAMGSVAEVQVEQALNG